MKVTHKYTLNYAKLILFINVHYYYNSCCPYLVVNKRLCDSTNDDDNNYFVGQIEVTYPSRRKAGELRGRYRQVRVAVSAVHVAHSDPQVVGQQGIVAVIGSDGGRGDAPQGEPAPASLLTLGGLGLIGGGSRGNADAQSLLTYYAIHIRLSTEN